MANLPNAKMCRPPPLLVGAEAAAFDTEIGAPNQQQQPWPQTPPGNRGQKSAGRGQAAGQLRPSRWQLLVWSCLDGQIERPRPPSPVWGKVGSVARLIIIAIITVALQVMFTCAQQDTSSAQFCIRLLCCAHVTSGGFCPAPIDFCQHDVLAAIH